MRNYETQRECVRVGSSSSPGRQALTSRGTPPPGGLYLPKQRSVRLSDDPYRPNRTDLLTVATADTGFRMEDELGIEEFYCISWTGCRTPPTASTPRTELCPTGGGYGGFGLLRYLAERGEYPGYQPGDERKSNPEEVSAGHRFLRNPGGRRSLRISY